ncbi:hypothetical protein HPP92_005438 [Vanilla planifolia]|uniref:Uncharacterized protein n=1 Tax=Vanilla planifolia TaxID=51239 RepID=A0A835RS58_VANPL|nr:hypothetical protein HPP92_005438 [Vanilla planifolia]
MQVKQGTRRHVTETKIHRHALPLSSHGQPTESPNPILIVAAFLAVVLAEIPGVGGNAVGRVIRTGSDLLSSASDSTWGMLRNTVALLEGFHGPQLMMG